MTNCEPSYHHRNNILGVKVEAKDTVMKKRWMSKEVKEDQERLMLAQAEISFKAGQESAGLVYNPDYLDFQKGVDTGRDLGRREVVEWGKETSCPHALFGEGTHYYKRACDLCWQEKWGVDMEAKDRVLPRAYGIFLDAKREYMEAQFKKRGSREDIGGHTEEAGVSAGCDAVAKAQAEISFEMERLIKQARGEGFKAGYSEGFKLGANNLIASLNEGKEYGRREVVEFIQNDEFYCDDLMDGDTEYGEPDRYLVKFSRDNWQAFKKEMGISPLKGSKRRKGI